MSGIPREVLKWIQSLDLTWQVKQPKWDLSNGYLVAEIFSWYFPHAIEMHMFNNGKSLESKDKNWDLLKNFIKRYKLEIPGEYIEGTIHCKEGAAQLLAERMYEILTNRRVKVIPPEYEIDFTDRAYQVQLPIHARSTASQAVKNNIRITEFQADQDLILAQRKAVHLITEHVEHRRMERVEDPIRFQRKPTLGELAVRRPPPPQKSDTEVSMVNTDDKGGGKEGDQVTRYSNVAENNSDEDDADEYSHLLQLHQPPQDKAHPQGTIRRCMTYLVEKMEELDKDNAMGDMDSRQISKDYRSSNNNNHRNRHRPAKSTSDDLRHFDKYKYHELEWSEDRCQRWKLEKTTRYHEVQVKQSSANNTIPMDLKNLYHD